MHSPKLFKQFTGFVAGLFLLSGFFTFPVAAEDASIEKKTPKIALVLQGGGALGIAHIAVIEELDRLGIPVDLVVGTSMGAIVGGLYSSGYSADDLELLVNTTDWMELFIPQTPYYNKPIRDRYDESRYLSYDFSREKVPVARGFLSDRNILSYFDQLTLDYGNNIPFSSLPREFRAVATDITNGERVVISEGSLSEAMRASMGIPGLFAPYYIQDRLLVDGGLVDNLPIDVAREAGADYIIAIQLTGGMPFSPEELKSSPLGSLSKTIDIMIYQNVKSNYSMADFILNIDLTGYQAVDFMKSEEILAIGKRTVEANTENLAELKDQLLRMGAHSKVSDITPQKIDHVQINGASRQDLRKIREEFSSFEGAFADRETVKSVMDDLSRNDIYKEIRLGRVVNESGRSDLVLDLERNREINSVNIGFSSASTYSDRINSLDVISGALILRGVFIPESKWTLGFQINDTPGLSLSYLQPFGPIYTNLSYQISTDRVLTSSEDTGGGPFQVRSSKFQMETGINPMNIIDFSIGLDYDYSVLGDKYAQINDLDQDEHLQILFSEFEFLTLDHFLFPEKGIHVNNSFFYNLHGFSGDESFQVLETFGTVAMPVTSLISLEAEWIGGTDFSGGGMSSQSAPILYKPNLGNRRIFPGTLNEKEEFGSFVSGGSLLFKYRVDSQHSSSLFPMYLIFQGAAGYVSPDAGQIRKIEDSLSWHFNTGVGFRFSDSFGLMVRTGTYHGFDSGNAGFIAIDIGSFGVRD